MLVFIVVSAAVVAGVIVYALVQKSKEQAAIKPSSSAEHFNEPVKEEQPKEAQAAPLPQDSVSEPVVEAAVEEVKKPKATKKAGTRKPKAQK